MTHLWIDRQTCSLERLAHATFCSGNRLFLLQDGPKVFSAWEKEISKAKHFVLFANYIIHDDGVGLRLATALKSAYRRGVKVFVLYDWFGSFGTGLTFWKELQDAGVVVQRFKPPTLLDPLANFVRYHGKMMCIDGTVGFVGGLCVGDEWMGYKDRGIEPWRDTAIFIEGPAVLFLAKAFEQAYRFVDPSFVVPKEALNHREILDTKEGLVQIIAGIPQASRFYQSLNSLLSTASSRIWITNAYFSMPRALYDALIMAAKSNVDVRVLVPRHSDIPILSLWSRSGYKELLEAGVRIFEWEGPMLHAKSVVVDTLFSTVGSSNLNSISLKHSWEVDVLIKDPEFAHQMEQMFLRDQQNASEILLSEKFRYVVKSAMTDRLMKQSGHESKRKSLFPVDTKLYQKKMTMRIQKTKAAVVRAGAAVFGGAIQRQFEQSVIPFSFFKSVILLALFILVLLKPWVVGMPIAVICLWLGLIYLGNSIAEGIRRYRDRSRNSN